MRINFHSLTTLSQILLDSSHIIRKFHGRKKKKYLYMIKFFSFFIFFLRLVLLLLLKRKGKLFPIDRRKRRIQELSWDTTKACLRGKQGEKNFSSFGCYQKQSSDSVEGLRRHIVLSQTFYSFPFCLTLSCLSRYTHTLGKIVIKLFILNLRLVNVVEILKLKLTFIDYTM